VLAAGTITLTPSADFTGGASFVCTVSDGVEPSPIAVAVVVSEVNDAPIAVDDTFTTALATPITIKQAQLLANDTDVDTAPLDATAVSSATNGTIVDNGNNTYTLTPTLAGTATFQDTLSDGIVNDTGLVTITVTS